MARGVEGCATLVWMNRSGTMTQEIREQKPAHVQTGAKAPDSPQPATTGYQTVDPGTPRYVKPRHY
ncbi:MAG: hypothetical protein A3I05_06615 [Deltaproteobacteria bacterium RIFCSPLOWO2_02_FULL_44_10]|nr:MAG: hypothetical protein A3C46_06815 [Deltaproteobacteria bacterium RIFCSPHIGHO2_02_FULL_44_16]OGQ46704.1 MAG: hypothetical protein A3I05_06615 [Deltaproteobacteria bacterium RIFCSPLOWO2_02_FULL_44_10]